MDQVMDLVRKAQWPDVILAMAKLPPSEAADLLAGLPDYNQHALFAQLPVELAAQVLAHFPYYLQYVLLHTRQPSEMRAILDQMNPSDRMQFLDELPEEAWQRLEEEIGELPREVRIYREDEDAVEAPPAAQSATEPAMPREPARAPRTTAMREAPLRELPVSETPAEEAI